MINPCELKWDEILGSGKLGDTWKASQGQNHFAVKIIRYEEKLKFGLKDVEEMVSNCLRISYPFLTKYISFFRDSTQNEVYIVKEFCANGNLDKKIKSFDRSNKIDENELMKIIIQLLLGVAELHRNNIVHRNIKERNVLIGADGKVKLGDYEWRKIIDMTFDKFELRICPYFVAPEVYRGNDYSFPADIWSLGVLFYYLFTGAYPFEDFEMETSVTEGVYAKISDEVCSTEMRGIIEQMLSVKEMDRPTALTLLDHPYILKFAGQLKLIEYFPKK